MEDEGTPDVSPAPEQSSKDSTPKAAPVHDHQSSDDAEAEDGDGGYDESALDRNPEAPAELLDRGDLISADNIGDTVFSKHWLFSTLMRLIQAVDQEGGCEESTVTDAGVDLGEGLQDELCKLWDMSMNGEIVKFLQEFKAVDIFTGVVAKSKAPRATEICIGILGNMACNEEASKEMAASANLIELVLLLLADPDAPTLVETMRLLLTVISNRTYGPPWISAIKRKDSVLGDIMFILSSSTNNDLLRNTAMFLDKLLDIDEGLCAEWALPQFVSALLEAVKQTGVCSGNSLDTFLHIFQLISTTEMGVNSLVTNTDEVCRHLLQYLQRVCADDIVGVEGCENTIASSLSTLSVLMASSPEQSKYVLEDFELVRCVLKILDVVFQKIDRAKSKRGHLHSRRLRSGQRTTSKSASSPPRDDNPVDPLSCGDGKNEQRDSIASDRGAKTSPSQSTKTRNGENEEITGCAVNTTDPKKDPEVENDRTRTRMLYEVLQGFAGDLIDILNVPEALEKTPKCLSYMDAQGPRDRIYSLVWTLQGLEKDAGSHHEAPPPCDVKVKVLLHVTELYHLERLHRIIDDALSV